MCFNKQCINNIVGEVKIFLHSSTNFPTYLYKVFGGCGDFLWSSWLDHQKEKSTILGDYLTTLLNNDQRDRTSRGYLWYLVVPIFHCDNDIMGPRPVNNTMLPHI
jgi:hypothetical protein